MSQRTSPGRDGQRPTLGLVGQVLGIVGAAVCALLVVAILFGKGWVQERVEVLSTGAVKALDSAIAVSETVITGLESGAAEAADVKRPAEALAANPTIDEQAFTALQQRLSPLATRYQAARDNYVELREKATNLLDTVSRIDRLLPGIDLPEGPVELLTGMDERLVALDTALSDLSANASSRSAASESAAEIAQAVGRLEDGIGNATAFAEDVQDELRALQVDVNGFERPHRFPADHGERRARARAGLGHPAQPGALDAGTALAGRLIGVLGRHRA